MQKLSEDEERQAQSDRELSRADARVQQARKGLSTFVTSSTSFFATTMSIASGSANDEDKKESIALRFFN